MSFLAGLFGSFLSFGSHLTVADFSAFFLCAFATALGLGWLGTMCSLRMQAGLPHDDDHRRFAPGGRPNRSHLADNPPAVPRQISGPYCGS